MLATLYRSLIPPGLAGAAVVAQTAAGADSWARWLETFGVAVVGMAALAYVIARVAVWVAREVLIPLRDRLMGRIIAFLDDLDVRMKRHEEAQRVIQEEQRATREVLQRIAAQNTESWQRCQEIHGELLDRLPPRKNCS